MIFGTTHGDGSLNDMTNTFCAAAYIQAGVGFCYFDFVLCGML